MSSHGFKLSELGYDVKTCDEENLVYTSKYPSLKIISVIPLYFVVNSDDYTITFPHNLGYVPVVQAVVYWYGDATYYFRGILPLDTDGGIMDISVDSNNVYIRSLDLWHPTIEGNLYLFADKIS